MDEKLIERIRKLDALANGNGATDGERENARSMAANICRSRGIDIADVRAEIARRDAPAQAAPKASATSSAASAQPRRPRAANSDWTEHLRRKAEQQARARASAGAPYQRAQSSARRREETGWARRQRSFDNAQADAAARVAEELRRAEEMVRNWAGGHAWARAAGQNGNEAPKAGSRASHARSTRAPGPEAMQAKGAGAAAAAAWAVGGARRTAAGPDSRMQARTFATATRAPSWRMLRTLGTRIDNDLALTAGAITAGLVAGAASPVVGAVLMAGGLVIGLRAASGITRMRGLEGQVRREAASMGVDLPKGSLWQDPVSRLGEKLANSIFKSPAPAQRRTAANGFRPA